MQMHATEFAIRFIHVYSLFIRCDDHRWRHHLRNSALHLGHGPRLVVLPGESAVAGNQPCMLLVITLVMFRHHSHIASARRHIYFTWHCLAPSVAQETARFFINNSREIQRLASVLNSPIFSHFSESLQVGRCLNCQYLVHATCFLPLFSCTNGLLLFPPVSIPPHTFTLNSIRARRPFVRFARKNGSLPKTAYAWTTAKKRTTFR